MKISVIADDGSECFSYDTAKDSLCLHPGQAEVPAVVEALKEALRFLGASRKTAASEDQIKHMVNRFLGWKLPENFNPDAGISFKRTFNESTEHPMKHEPTGTNLFDAEQATAMVRYMLEGSQAG